MCSAMCVCVCVRPVLMLCSQAGFAASGYPAVKPELDLVEDEDQITHEMSLDDKHDPQVSCHWQLGHCVRNTHTLPSRR